MSKLSRKLQLFMQCSCIHVFSICSDRFNVFNRAKVEKVGGAVDFMVELLWIGQLQFIVHCC